MVFFKELKQSAHVVVQAVVRVYERVIGTYMTANLLIAFLVLLAALLLVYLGLVTNRVLAPVPTVPGL